MTHVQHEHPRATTESRAMNTSDILDKIMEQAQVFASSWSLLGGPFDNGDGLETAEREKSELRDMIAAEIAREQRLPRVTQEMADNLKKTWEEIDQIDQNMQRRRAALGLDAREQQAAPVAGDLQSLRDAFSRISLAEADSSTSAAAKVRDMARIARAALEWSAAPTPQAASPEPMPEFARFVDTPEKRFLYDWGKRDGYQDGFAAALATPQPVPSSEAVADLRKEMERYWDGFSSRHQLTDAIEAVIATLPAAPAAVCAKEATAMLNLEMDIRRVIGWEKPICDFEVVKELQDYIQALGETATPAAVPTDEQIDDAWIKVCTGKHALSYHRDFARAILDLATRPQGEA